MPAGTIAAVIDPHPQRPDDEPAPATPPGGEPEPMDVDEQVAAMIASDAAPEELAPAIEEQAPQDAADALEQLEPTESAEVLQLLDTDTAADALANMELPLAATVLLDLDPAESATLIGEMQADDAVDLLQILPRDLRENILARLPPKRAAQLGKLVHYDPESAGGIMTTDILVVRSAFTIGQAIDFIKRHSIEEDQHDVYVVDDQKRLIGTITLRQLLVIDDGEPVIDHIDTDIDALTADMDREDVARIFERYDYLTLPVVDAEQRILGMVTIDDVIDIIRAEGTEDMMKQVGAGAEESVLSPVGQKVRGRLPWLLVNLPLASVGAVVILYFDNLIAALPVLAVLNPIIANQAGNTGHQSMAVTLRGLVLGSIRKERVWPLLRNELVFGIITGVATGALVMVVVIVLARIGATGQAQMLAAFSPQLGVVAGAAMLGTLLVSCMIGTGIPLVMKRLGFDPATASSIFVTMFTDAVSYFAFLGLVFLLAGWLGIPGLGAGNG